MLHLLARAKLVGSGARPWGVRPQFEAAHDSGQGAVGDAAAVLVLEDLLHPDHIALGDLEHLRDDGGKLLIGGLPSGCRLPLSPDDPADRGPREFEELADLPEIGVFEVLDFVRFLKAQWSGMDAGERFDRAWMAARRIAREQGITDEDITAEITRARQRQ